jgi:hypothetical protein
MGKAGFLSFFVVLAEIPNGVKRFFRNDGAMMRMVPPQKKMGSLTATTVADPSFKAYSSAQRAASPNYPRPAGRIVRSICALVERSTLQHSSNGGHSNLPLRWGAELVVS